MEKIKRVRLESGAELFLVTNDKYTTSTVQFVFPVGWRHDEEKYLGLAHFFEHLVGKRTKNFPGKTQISMFLEKEGIVSNAYTAPELTCYHHSNSHKKLIFSLEKLLEIIYFSQYVEEDLIMEKEVVMTEARMYLDDDDSFLWHKMMGKIFPGTTLERFYLGNDESLKNINVQVFQDFYKLYLNPKNTKIFIGTNNLKQEKQILALLNKFYKENRNILTNKKIEKLKDKFNKDKSETSSLLINKNDKTQANIRLAWKIPVLNKKDRITFSILRRVLTAGFSARLMKKLRDELGLIYGISLDRNTFVGGLSYMMFSTACSKNEKEKVFRIIRDEIQLLRKNLTQVEIDNVIPMLEYFQERQVNVENDVSNILDSVITNTDYINTEEFMKLIKKVKVSDVKKLIDKIFKDEFEIKGVLE